MLLIVSRKQSIITGDKSEIKRRVGRHGEIEQEEQESETGLFFTRVALLTTLDLSYKHLLSVNSILT